MENVINKVEPGQVVAAIDPAYVELYEYTKLVQSTKEYYDSHEGVRRALEWVDVLPRFTGTS